MLQETPGSQILRSWSFRMRTAYESDRWLCRFVTLSSVNNKATSAPTCWRDLRRVETWKMPRTRRVPERSAKPRQQKRVAKGKPTRAQRLGAYIRWSLSGRCCPTCFAALVMVLFCYYSGSWRASAECFHDWLKGRALASRRIIFAMWNVSGSSKVWLQRLVLELLEGHASWSHSGVV